jgi:hypothetical protein
MCERLGIQIIAASSPQAKGRVERNNGVQQDRLDVEQEAVRQIHVPQHRARSRERWSAARRRMLCGAVGRSGSAPCCHQFESNLRGHF